MSKRENAKSVNNCRLSPMFTVPLRNRLSRLFSGATSTVWTKSKAQFWVVAVLFRLTKFMSGHLPFFFRYGEKSIDGILLLKVAVTLAGIVAVLVRS
jgi:hypothetical protein